MHFRTDTEFATREFKARTPDQALAKARRFDQCKLSFEPYDGGGLSANEIAVCDENGDEFVVWYDDELRVRLAAHDLLEALVNLEAQIEGAYGDIDLTEANAAIAKAIGPSA